MAVFQNSNRITIKRRISQGFGLLLGCLGIIVPSMTHIIYPGLHCYSCPLSVTICAVGIMQNFSASNTPPVFPLAFLGLYGIVLGRWWCGWLCPFGIVNDVFIFLRSKNRIKQILVFISVCLFTLTAVFIFIYAQNRWIAVIPSVFLLFSLFAFITPSVPETIRRKTSSGLFIGIMVSLFAFFFMVILMLEQKPVSILLPAGIFFILATAGGMTFGLGFSSGKKQPFIMKYIILILTIGFAYIASDTVFCKLCPSAALSAALPYFFTNPLYIPGVMYWIKIGVLLFVVISLLFVSRFFCRVLCPLGAIFGLANKISWLKIRRNLSCDTADKKICKYACLSSCIMGIRDIHKKEILMQTDCIKCGKCIEACPNSYLRFNLPGKKAE